MPFLDSLPEGTAVADLYRRDLDLYRPWIRMGERVLSGPSPLSAGERELIATFVSALNGCEYCVASHLPNLDAHGIDPAIVGALVADIDSAPVREPLKPLFRLCRRLTLAPARVAREDIDAVLAAGWDERALDSAIAVVCRFSYLNRLVQAYGLDPPDESTARATAAELVRRGYDDYYGLGRP